MTKIILTSSEELKSLLESSISKYMDELKQTIDEKLNPIKSKLTVTELTVRNYISKGYIKAEKIGRRILIDIKDLDNLLSEVKYFKYRR